MRQPLQVQLDLKVLFYGQLIALSLACCSAASSVLQSIVCIPLFQIAGGYFFLSFNLFKLKRKDSGLVAIDRDTYMNKESETTLLLHNGNGLIKQMTDLSKEEVASDDEAQHHTVTGMKLPQYKLPIMGFHLHSPWYFYLLFAFLDVQANYLVVLSFQYTSLINTNLLTSLSIISVMTTSKIILKRVFKAYHFIGVFLVLLGASFIVSSDFKSREGHDLSNHELLDVDNANGNTKLHLRGDLFAVTAALLFGLNDTLAEYCIETSTIEEYLAMLGIFGYFFSISESILFERREVQQFLQLVLHSALHSYSSLGDGEIDGDDIHVHNEDGHADYINLGNAGLVWVVYIVCLVFFYTSASKFLRVSDATLLNLSLQSSNMWTICFSILVQSIFPTPLFYCAVVVMFVGVWIYEKGF